MSNVIDFNAAKRARMPPVVLKGEPIPPTFGDLDYLKGWFRWFAWHPVYVQDVPRRMVWLRMVERAPNWNYHIGGWMYRASKSRLWFET